MEKGFQYLIYITTGGHSTAILTVLLGASDTGKHKMLGFFFVLFCCVFFKSAENIKLA